MKRSPSPPVDAAKKSRWSVLQFWRKSDADEVEAVKEDVNCTGEPNTDGSADEDLSPDLGGEALSDADADQAETAEEPSHYVLGRRREEDLRMDAEGAERAAIAESADDFLTPKREEGCSIDADCSEPVGVYVSQALAPVVPSSNSLVDREQACASTIVQAPPFRWSSNRLVAEYMSTWQGLVPFLEQVLSLAGKHPDVSRLVQESLSDIYQPLREKNEAACAALKQADRHCAATKLKSDTSFKKESDLKASAVEAEHLLKEANAQLSQSKARQEMTCKEFGAWTSALERKLALRSLHVSCYVPLRDNKLSSQKAISHGSRLSLALRQLLSVDNSLLDSVGTTLLLRPEDRSDFSRNALGIFEDEVERSLADEASHEHVASLVSAARKAFNDAEQAAKECAARCTSLRAQLDEARRARISSRRRMLAALARAKRALARATAAKAAVEDFLSATSITCSHEQQPRSIEPVDEGAESFPQADDVDEATDPEQDLDQTVLGVIREAAPSPRQTAGALGERNADLEFLT
eukprot:TRINITY_DN22629_c0_g1_i1.p1 TRINITY_DN22629_c0_g1~~TRINITY_DN22629_c0_g1_i1.p1  ORF type:complete len:525 (-),score=106.85 TRINITY_DN22629_c0_g1_i1:266-1840(-)